MVASPLLGPRCAHDGPRRCKAPANVRRVRQSRESSRRGIEGPLSDTIEFQLLGATEARRDGEPVPLSGARRRALVARLLLDADRVVRADALIEDVWDGSPRPAA